MVRRPLLFCGVLSSLLYVAATIVGAAHWEGYDPLSQTISELSAIDAPSRPWMVPIFLLYGLLVIAFGVGIRRSAGDKRTLRVLGGLMVGYGLIDLAAPFMPIHLRGVEPTLTDTLHIISTMVTVLLIVVMIGLGAAAFRARFRQYSIATALVVVLFGALTGLCGPRIAENLPTPWAGLTERICVFGFLLWVIALAIRLLPAHQTSASRQQRGPTMNPHGIAS